MKRISFILVVLLSVMLLSGCAAMVKTPIGSGSTYTNVTLGNGAYWQNDVSSNKVGRASCTNILGIVVTGDASIQEAMKNGGIQKIHHTDYRIESILGVYSKLTTIVYGE